MDRLGDGDVWDDLDDDKDFTLSTIFMANDGDGSESQSDAGPSAGLDALVFLIDFRRDMVESVDEHGVPLLHASLRCCAEVLKSKVICRDYDLVGVVGFGTEKTDNPNSFQNIFVVRNLEPPDAGGIVELERLAREPEYMQNAYGHLPSEPPLAFHLCLWTCRTLFSQSKASTSVGSRRRVFIFTCDDDPSKGDEAQRTQSGVQAGDLADSGAFVEVVCLRGGAEAESFDLTKFFGDVVIPDEDQLSGRDAVVPIARFSEMRNQIRRREHRKRMSDRCRIVLDKDRALSLVGYPVVKKASRGTTVKLDARSNEPTQSVTVTWCSETAKTLYPREIGFGYQYLGTMAGFTASDRASVRDAATARELQCLGFVPRSKVSRDLHLRQAMLFHPCFPEETTVPEPAIAHGKLFSALGRAMQEEDLVMLVYGATARAGQQSRFFYFCPQSEEQDRGNQVVPPGWLLVSLPFEDDVRNDFIEHLAPSKEPFSTLGERASANQVNAAEQLVKKLSSPSWNPAEHSNPDLQTYLAGLQALALGGQGAATVPDDIMPDDDEMLRRADVELKSLLKELDLTDGVTGFGVQTRGGSRSTRQQKRPLQ